MVSIVIPAYNAETYLDECLRSVEACVADSRTDCEVIVVDDGSTDSTVTIAGRYNVRIVSQPNSGLSAARNAGIRVSCGEWLMFVDADDCLLPGAVDNLVDLATATKCRVAAGRCIKGRDCPAFTKQSLIPGQVLSGPTAVEQTLYQQTPLLGSAWGKLWTRDIFATELFTDGLYYEDLDFFYRAFLLCGAVAVTDTPVYFYRQHQTSFIHIFSPHTTDVLKVIERMEGYLSQSYPVLLPAALDRRFSANFNIFNRIISETRMDTDLGLIADACWKQVKRLRWRTLLNPRSRAKNKLGALTSMSGRSIYTFIFKRLLNSRHL